ncbi:hypothetical protein [Teredinibacter franksiae]|uniref:hypothetical protein n=1 Tax=Teredinibacter franksiae TaxID=2761453 RepID=UPI00162613E9|nr:hypothetical protein [Teredinibacter franksiae]
MFKYWWFAIVVFISSLSSADNGVCTGKEYKKYVKEVSYRSSPSICKSGTKMLEFKLVKGFDEGEERFGGILVEIGNENAEVVTHYKLNLYSSKYQSGAHTCINEKYLPYSKVVFGTTLEVVDVFENNGRTRSKISIKNKQEKCSISNAIST